MLSSIERNVSQAAIAYITQLALCFANGVSFNNHLTPLNIMTSYHCVLKYVNLLITTGHVAQKQYFLVTYIGERVMDKGLQKFC